MNNTRSIWETISNVVFALLVTAALICIAALPVAIAMGY